MELGSFRGISVIATFWHLHLVLECLLIFSFLRHVGRHGLAGTDYTDSAINVVRRFENTRRSLTACKVALALFRAFLLEVKPHVLFDFGALLLHLNFVRVLQGLDFLAFSLPLLVIVARLQSKVFRKLKLCHS